MLITKITAKRTNYDQNEVDLSFSNTQSDEWVLMFIDGQEYSIKIEDLMDCIIPFHSKLQREKYNDD